MEIVTEVQTQIKLLLTPLSPVTMSIAYFSIILQAISVAKWQFLTRANIIVFVFILQGLDHGLVVQPVRKHELRKIL